MQMIMQQEKKINPSFYFQDSLTLFNNQGFNGLKDSFFDEILRCFSSLVCSVGFSFFLDPLSPKCQSNDNDNGVTNSLHV